MTDFVGYFRVSTDRQGRSGLGLEAQREAVSRHIAQHGSLLAEFTEIESGKRNDRPALAEALSLCRRHKATLLIARLDRLARSVAFISNLMESGVEFVAVDMPEANRLTLHILAAVAEHERDVISIRTRAALKAAKARGVRLGNPHAAQVAPLAHKANRDRADRFAETIAPLIDRMRRRGLSYAAIAAELNDRHIPTARGGAWHGTTVRNVWLRLAKQG
ncbi:MAG: recombinase family protein [Marinobacter nauticus]